MNNKLLSLLKKFGHININISKSNKIINNNKFCYIHTKPYESENDLILTDEDRKSNESIIKPCTEDLSNYASYLKPTFNFAAYINQSESLQELVKLGVDLHRLEKKKGIPNFILKLNFENDIKKHILFLHHLGLPDDQLGNFVTKNPLIFKEDLDNLQTRVNYLKTKKFSEEMISEIIVKNPYWLMFSTQRIDKRLGYFQKTFELDGKDVRTLSVYQPRLITYNMEHIRVNTFAIREEMGFSLPETQTLLLNRPKLWMINQKSLINRFEYVYNVMKISHEMISKQSVVLTHREFRIRQRHMFLEKIGRAQYDPKKENYVSLEMLVLGNDIEFCRNVAKSTVEMYNLFLKTL